MHLDDDQQVPALERDVQRILIALLAIGAATSLTSSHDVGDNCIHAGFAGHLVTDNLALAERDNTIRDREDVGEAVANEDDRDALAFQFTNEI